MKLLQFFRDLRRVGRAAGFHGAALEAESRGNYEQAHALAKKAFETVRSTAADSPPAAAIRLTSVVLLDQVSAKLGKPAPREEMLESLVSAKEFSSAPEFDKSIRWLQHRIDELGDDSHR